MSVEALWHVRFGYGEQLESAGTVTLETNKLYGGDSQYYYLGEYKVSGNQLCAKFNSQHYHGVEEQVWQPLEGYPNPDQSYAEIVFVGQMSGNEIVGTATRDGCKPLDVRMRKLANLE